MGLLNKATEIYNPSSRLTENNIRNGQSDFSDIQADKKKSGSQEEDWLRLDDIIERPPDSSGTSETEKDVFSEEDLNAAIFALQKLPEDIESVGNIFSILKQHLHINKGAILLYDRSENIFPVWASHGYDKTTQHRLHLPESLFNDPVNIKKPIIFNSENIAMLKPYLSIREYAVTEKAILFPFIYKDELIAYLLITDSDIIPALGKIEESETFQLLSTIISVLLYNSREKKLQKLKKVSVRSREQILDQITLSVSQAQTAKTKVFFFRLDISSVLNEIQKNESYSAKIDPYRIKDDIQRILTAMMPENDKIFFIDQNNLLCILSGKYHINAKLFIHQMRLAVQGLFSSLKTVPDFREKILIYPQDADEPQTIIGAILS